MSNNNMNDNQKFFEFAEKLNNETIELMAHYDTSMPSTIKNELLEKIKLRIDILSPIKELQLKEQQITSEDNFEIIRQFIERSDNNNEQKEALIQEGRRLLEKVS